MLVKRVWGINYRFDQCCEVEKGHYHISNFSGAGGRGGMYKSPWRERQGGKEGVPWLEVSVASEHIVCDSWLKGRGVPGVGLQTYVTCSVI